MKLFFSSNVTGFRFGSIFCVGYPTFDSLFVASDSTCYVGFSNTIGSSTAGFAFSCYFSITIVSIFSIATTGGRFAVFFGI